MKYGKLIGKILAQKSNNNAQVAVAIVAGLAAGAVISVLFAPKKGTETRKLIGNTAKNAGDGLKNTYASLKDKIVNTKAEDIILKPKTRSVPKKRKSINKELIAEVSRKEKQS